MKIYLKCSVTRPDKSVFICPIRLSETHLITVLARQNAKVTVYHLEIGEGRYNDLFNL